MSAWKKLMMTRPKADMQKKDFILASSSKQRQALLEQIGIVPKQIVPANINEQIKDAEMPLPYIRRIAREKAKAVAALFPNENILSADTIITAGRKIIQKSPDAAAQTAVMELLSARTHRVITSVCLIRKDGHIAQKTVTTKITMKHLTRQEIAEYVASNEWVGVAGYKIEGLLASYVKKITGSYSGVVGLPLYETKNLLNGAGIC